MKPILILYASTDGHTLEIAQRIQAELESHGNQTICYKVDDYLQDSLKHYDTFVIGASIRYGKHSKSMHQFVKKNASYLNKQKTFFFSVNAVARKPHKRHLDTNPYVAKFLNQCMLEPTGLAIFGGKIDYKKYGFFDKLMIRIIMRLTHGPTDLNACVDFTNWNDVSIFTSKINQLQQDTLHKKAS